MASDPPPNFLANRLKKLLGAQDTATKVSALLAGKWVQDGLRFLLLLWLARTSQAGFGLFVFGLSVAFMIRSIMIAGLDKFTIRELAANHEMRRDILGQMIRLKLVVGCLAIIVILSFGWLNHWNRTQIMVVLIISAAQILEGVADTFFSLYRLAGHQVQEGLYSAKAALLGALYGAAAIWLGGDIVAFSFFVMVTNGFKAILAAALGMRSGLMPTLNCRGSILPPGKTTSLLIIVAVSFLGSFFNHIQVFLLKYFKALGDLALYGAASELGGGLVGLVTTFVVGGVLFPAWVERTVTAKEKLAGTISAYFWRLAAFGLGAAFFFYTLGGDLLLLVYGTTYTASIIPLQIIGFASLFSFVNNLLIDALLAEHQERLLFRLQLAPTLVSLALGLFLIPWFGANGAALNLLACRATLSLLILAVAQKRYGVFRKREVYAFLWGVLILGGTYLGLLAVNLPAPYLSPALALMAFGLWTWRWTVRPANLGGAGKREPYEAG